MSRPVGIVSVLISRLYILPRPHGYQNLYHGSDSSSFIADTHINEAKSSMISTNQFLVLSPSLLLRWKITHFRISSIILIWTFRFPRMICIRIVWNFLRIWIWCGFIWPLYRLSFHYFQSFWIKGIIWCARGIQGSRGYIRGCATIWAVTWSLWMMRFLRWFVSRRWCDVNGRRWFSEWHCFAILSFHMLKKMKTLS